MQESNGNQPEEEQYEENEDEEIDPLAYAELVSTNGCEDIPRVISEAFEAKNLIAMREEDLSGPIIKKTKSESIIAKANLGSPMTFINKKTAQRLQTNEKSANFSRYNSQEDAAINLVCYNGKKILPKGRLRIAIE